MFHDPVFFHGQYSDCKQADIEYNIVVQKSLSLQIPRGSEGRFISGTWTMI